MSSTVPDHPRVELAARPAGVRGFAHVRVETVPPAAPGAEPVAIDAPMCGGTVRRVASRGAP